MSDPFYLFDRPRSPHPWRQAFQELESDPSWRFVCENWRMDHRVSAEREEEVMGHELGNATSGDDFQAQLSRYFAHALCRPTTPVPGGRLSAYLEAHNLSNHVAGASTPLYEQLLHVGSLNAILARLGSALGSGGRPMIELSALLDHPLPAGPAMGDPHGDLAFRQRVAEFAWDLLMRGEQVFRQAIGLLTSALGERQPPWWACFAAELAPLTLAEDATNLCRALGLGHLAQGEYLLVWRYDLALLEDHFPGVPLCRPTVLEARDNPYHFPSPPGALFGLTLPLAPGLPGPCREVLHPPLTGDAAGAACLFGVFQLVGKALPEGRTIGQARREQAWRLLLARTDSQPWLERHRLTP